MLHATSVRVTYLPQQQTHLNHLNLLASCWWWHCWQCWMPHLPLCGRFTLCAYKQEKATGNNKSYALATCNKLNWNDRLYVCIYVHMYVCSNDASKLFQQCMQNVQSGGEALSTAITLSCSSCSLTMTMPRSKTQQLLRNATKSLVLVCVCVCERMRICRLRIWSLLHAPSQCDFMALPLLHESARHCVALIAASCDAPDLLLLLLLLLLLSLALVLVAALSFKSALKTF